MKNLLRTDRTAVRRWLPGLGVALAIAGAVALLADPPSAATAAENPPIPSRAELTSWKQNGHDGRYVLQVIEGRLPAETTTGTILSDTQCEPDAQMINHCHNQIRLANGETITVIDNHSMMVNPCLAPGATMTIQTLETGWIVGTLS